MGRRRVIDDSESSTENYDNPFLDMEAEEASMDESSGSFRSSEDEDSDELFEGGTAVGSYSTNKIKVLKKRRTENSSKYKSSSLENRCTTKKKKPILKSAKRVKVNSVPTYADADRRANRIFHLRYEVIRKREIDEKHREFDRLVRACRDCCFTVVDKET